MKKGILAALLCLILLSGCGGTMRPCSREDGEPEVVPRMLSPSVPTGTGAFFVPKTQQRRRCNMQIYEELKARGLIAQGTDEEEIRELVNATRRCSP